MTPLWIRGTVASEPAMYYPYRGEELPLLIVDARTREGQSGSPVVLYRPPLTHVRTNGGRLRLTTTGATRLVGVYSGRASPDSDLGLVWRIEDVDVMCRAGTKASI